MSSQGLGCEPRILEEHIQIIVSLSVFLTYMCINMSSEDTNLMAKSNFGMSKLSTNVSSRGRAAQVKKFGEHNKCANSKP